MIQAISLDADAAAAEQVQQNMHNILTKAVRESRTRQAALKKILDAIEACRDQVTFSPEPKTLGSGFMKSSAHNALLNQKGLGQQS